MKNLSLFFAVTIGSTILIPTTATAKETSSITSLTPGQIEFIRQFDSSTGSNFTKLSTNPAAIPIIKSASIICGNVEMQKQFVYAAGGNATDASYASQKFESLFCGNKK